METKTDERMKADDDPQPVGKLLSLVKPPKKPLNESAQILKFECEICWDVGMEIVPGRGARMCECRLRKIKIQRLSVVPPKFAGVSLTTLTPRVDIHPIQAQAVSWMKESPDACYFLAGQFGTGKTMMMWALYLHAVNQNKPKVVACTLSELLNEYRKAIQVSVEGGQVLIPRLSAVDLRQDHTKYCIFLDDIDKAKPTEYVAEQFFEIADAIYAYQHQIVTTTNLRLQDLIAHFERADERFGGAIVRRLVDNAKIVEMF